VRRLTAAAQVLASLDRLAAEHGPCIDAIRTEIDYRRVQLGLAQSEAALAGAIASRLWETAPDDPWTGYANRAVFRDAVERWRAARDRMVRDDQALSDQITFGERVLAEYADDAASLQRPDVLGYHAIVAAAYRESHERSGNEAHARRALELYVAMLSQRANNREFLRAAALLCEELNEPRRALDYWRLLVAGSAADSDEWFEAKLHQISLLSRVEPARAKEVMDQHRQLYPDYGPDPWGARLRQLDERMRRSQAAPTGAPGASAEVGAS
jgi:hypothetical protein